MLLINSKENITEIIQIMTRCGNNEPATNNLAFDQNQGFDIFSSLINYYRIDIQDLQDHLKFQSKVIK